MEQQTNRDMLMYDSTILIEVEVLHFRNSDSFSRALTAVAYQQYGESIGVLRHREKTRNRRIHVSYQQKHEQARSSPLLAVRSLSVHREAAATIFWGRNRSERKTKELEKRAVQTPPPPLRRSTAVHCSSDKIHTTNSTYQV